MIWMKRLKLADKICIMSEGQVIQFDTPDNILRHPANDLYVILLVKID